MRFPQISHALLLGSLLAPGLAGCGDSTAEQPKPPAGPVGITDDQGKATTLTCPGSPECEKAQGDFLVGAAKKTITPQVEPWTDTNTNGLWDQGEEYTDSNKNGQWDGYYLAGFGNGRAATGVHDEIWARAITIEQGDVSVGMVALDMVGYFQQRVIEIRLAAKAAGLDFDHIVVASTHVHEAPDGMGMWGKDPSTTGIDPAFMDHIISQAVEALKEAKAGQKKATLKAAQAQRPELVNDTRVPKVIDQNINSLQFLDDAGGVITTAVFWGNHPEALGSDNTLITSDYPHYLREAIETKWPNAPAVFFNGPLGGLTTTIRIVGCPDAMGNETCAQGTWERAEYVGKGAGEAAVAALEAATATSDNAPTIGFMRRPFLLQPTNTSLGIAVLSGLMPRDMYWADGKKVTPEEAVSVGVGQLLQGEVVIGTEINGLQIGPVSIATVPGELYTELWLEKPGGGSFIETPDGRDYEDAVPETPIQSVLPGPLKFVVNNANDSLGYIIPLSQWDTLPPYTYGASEAPYGEENSSGIMTAPLITSEFVKMYAK